MYTFSKGEEKTFPILLLKATTAPEGVTGKTAVLQKKGRCGM
jgi:hypothetical protein